MAVLSIKKYNDPILRKKCRLVEEINKKTRRLIRDMLETMYKNQGVGLAAPQVGIDKQVIVVDAGGDPIALVNPKIIKKSSQQSVLEEGCLSLPKIYVKVKRAKEVVIQGLNKKNELVEIKARGLLSHAFQHEIDHLSGILIIDYLKGFRNILVKRKIDKLEKIEIKSKND